MIISNEDKNHTKLSKAGKDRAELPEMERKRQLWYEHNDLKTNTPVVCIFPENAWHEIIPPESLECECEEARFMETLLRGKLFRADVIRDDVPIEKTWEVVKIISDDGWIKGGHDSVSNNPDYRDNCLGGINYLWLRNYKYISTSGRFNPVIMEPQDLKHIKPPRVTYHEEESVERLKFIKMFLGIF